MYTRRIKAGIASLAVVPVLAIAGLSGATTASSSTTAASQSSSVVASGSSAAVGQAGTARASGLAVNPKSAPPTFITGAKSWKTTLAKKVIKYIKGKSGAMYKAMKSAVKKGYATFKRWYNSLAYLVRKAIDAIWIGGLESLWDYLKDILF